MRRSRRIKRRMASRLHLMVITYSHLTQPTPRKHSGLILYALHRSTRSRQQPGLVSKQGALHPARSKRRKSAACRPRVTLVPEPLAVGLLWYRGSEMHPSPTPRHAVRIALFCRLFLKSWGPHVSSLYFEGGLQLKPELNGTNQTPSASGSGACSVRHVCLGHPRLRQLSDFIKP